MPASIWSPRGRLERLAGEGRAGHGLERRGRLDVRREAVVEHVVGADAVGELLVVTGSRPTAGLRSTQSLRPFSVRMKRPELDLVLEVDADLLARLVDGREDRGRRDDCVVHRVEQVDRRARRRSRTRSSRRSRGSRRRTAATARRCRRCQGRGRPRVSTDSESIRSLNGKSKRLTVRKSSGTPSKSLSTRPAPNTARESTLTSKYLRFCWIENLSLNRCEKS